MKKAAPFSARLVRFGDAVSRVREQVDVLPEGTYLEIGIRSHGKGVFHKEPVSGAKLGEKAVFRVVPNCLAFNIIFAWEGAVATTRYGDEGRVASHRFPMFRINDGIADLEYLRLFLLSKRGLHLLRLASPGGAGRNRTLSLQSLLETRLPLPDIETQRRVALAAASCTRHEVALERAVNAKRRLKRALLQQLFHSGGTYRRSVELAAIVEALPVSGRKVPTSDYRQTGRHPIVDQGQELIAGYSDFDSPIVPDPVITVFGDHTKIVKIIDFPFVVGADGVRMFVPRDAQALDAFYLGYVIQVAAEQTPSLGYSRHSAALLREVVRVHSAVPEQRRVVRAFRMLDHEIALLDRQLAAYRQLKRGLMQKLLAGEIAIPAALETATSVSRRRANA